jgi:hypothetical protein
MEPSRRNQWQPVANAPSLKPQKQAKTVAVGCDRLPPNRDGKEGVDGSSPSEGSLQKPLLISGFRVVLVARVGDKKSHRVARNPFLAGPLLC